ncbi:DNAj-like protein [Cryptosporidium ryanae]|uniref:DNAj-like protein n=1 Tax=Cryptosporidium ryanae TaxID=515981 RepID=UPI00351A76E5|nr:DNAj-like protein [Cryptosporidium ryanae]
MSKVSENYEDKGFNITSSSTSHSFSNNNLNKKNESHIIGESGICVEENNSDDKLDLNEKKGDDSLKDEEFRMFMNEIIYSDINNNLESSDNRKIRQDINRKQKNKKARISKLILEGKLEQAITDSIDKISSNDGKDEYEDFLAVGTSEEEIHRITSRTFTNSYDVLNVPINSDELLINKKYRKLSLLIHPDKTKHDKANEAFDILNKAYQELQKAENKAKYKSVWKRAQELVKKELKKNSVNNLSKKEFNTKVLEMSEKLLKDLQEKKEYSEKCLIANQRFEQELNRKKLEEEKEKYLKRKKWSESFEERAMGWRCYKQNNSKLFNSYDY